jgi:hypothetical protein
MHYRVRGNSVQLVKTVRDEASGKAVSKPVGSLNLVNGSISESARENLTPEEIAGVEAWLARKQDVDRRKRQLDAELFSTTIGNMIQWTKEAGAGEVNAMAEDILFGLRDLQAAIAAKAKEQMAG